MGRGWGLWGNQGNVLYLAWGGGCTNVYSCQNRSNSTPSAHFNICKSGFIEKIKLERIVSRACARSWGYDRASEARPVSPLLKTCGPQHLTKEGHFKSLFQSRRNRKSAGPETRTSFRKHPTIQRFSYSFWPVKRFTERNLKKSHGDPQRPG